MEQAKLMLENDDDIVPKSIDNYGHGTNSEQ